MAQSTPDSNDIGLLSSIKADNRGWNIALFDVVNEALVCRHCHSVCCDAVELDCDHDEEDVYLYCKRCLADVIHDNHQKCPIDAHENPEVSANRSSRREILKSSVICPYSTEYKARCQRLAAARKSAANANANLLIDTMGDDEKEGHHKEVAIGIAAKESANEAGCEWQGTLKDLINRHLPECAKQNDAWFVHRIENERLNKKIASLQQQLATQSAQNASQRQQMVCLQDEVQAARKQIGMHLRTYVYIERNAYRMSS